MSYPRVRQLLVSTRTRVLTSAVLVPIVFCVLGLLTTYHATLFSGFADLPAGPGDSRFNQYILEHSYRWILAYPEDAHFWDPPMFYPARNTAAYSDVLLGVAPLYWIWRFLQIGPDVALGLWILVCSCLNFVVAHLLLRRGLACTTLASSLGAFLFAFAISRSNQLGHIQLLPQFYMALSLYALIVVFTRHHQGAPHARISGWIWLFFGSIVAQFYAGYYYGWFLIFSLGIAALWALVIPTYYATLISVLRSYAVMIGSSIVVAGLAVAPLMIHYLQAAQSLAPRQFATNVMPMIPRPQSWIYMGDSLLYSWQNQQALFGALPDAWEQRLGIGLLTMVVAVIGLYWARKHPFARLSLLVAGTIMVLATELPGGVVIWQAVFTYVPGADAVRAVARVGLVLLIPAAFGVASFVQHLQRRRYGWSALVICALCVVEQVPTLVTWHPATYRAEVAALSRLIAPSCKAFFYTPFVSGQGADWYIYQEDAMWAALQTGIPTLNGYSGNQPPGITYREGIVLHNAADEASAGRSLADWLFKNGVSPQGICWIKPHVTQ